jgi:WXG100 family type VII secretion target
VPVIAWNTAQLEAAVSQIRASHGRLQNHFAELQSHVAQLAQAWEGPDQQAYAGHQKKFNDSMQASHQTLRGLGLSVDNSKVNLQSATQANTRGWA